MGGWDNAPGFYLAQIQTEQHLFEARVPSQIWAKLTQHSSEMSISMRRFLHCSLLNEEANYIFTREKSAVDVIFLNLLFKQNLIMFCDTSATHNITLLG